MKYFSFFHRLRYIVFLIVLTTANFVNAQSQEDKELMRAYGKYTALDREVIYVHLNKTQFLEGEQLGYKAYIIDKHSGKPSINTANLYVQLVDMGNNVVKEQLLQVKKGTAHGTFRIDGLLGAQNYVLKAFTNWSKNFDEPNHFEQEIRVVDLERSMEEAISVDTVLEVTFMPEGGHFIANTLNSLGIRVREQGGGSMPNLGVRLLDRDNEVQKVFTLNDKGLAKILVTPKIGSSLRLGVTYKGEEHFFPLPKAEERGFGLILSNRKKSLLFNLNTNAATLPDLKRNDYKLAIHNGTSLKILKLPKFETTSSPTNIPKEDLFEGINILTVLDQNNTPLLERLYFHGARSKIKRYRSHEVVVEGDSLDIQLTYRDAIPEGSFSVSVLPAVSTADHQRESIASMRFLGPHLSKVVEDAAAYFQKGALSDEDLDLMLLTQGWSAYDWSNIMYFPPKEAFEFEKGIKATVTNTKNKAKNWIAFPHQGIELKRLRSLDLNNTYEMDSLFPYPNERLRISEINRRGDFREPLIKGDIQFSPNAIPRLDKLSISTVNTKSIDRPEPGEEFDFILFLDKKTIALEEVEVSEEKIKDPRLKNLIDFSFGEVTVFDEELRKKWPNVIAFLQSQLGFRLVRNAVGNISIINNVPGIPPPSVYLDAATLQSPVLNGQDNMSLLEGLRSTDIAYIEVNRFGLGEGVRGAGGVIRIFTRSDYSEERTPYQYLDVDYPLTFSRPEQYAVPIYTSYTDESYLQYGVLGWYPSLSLTDSNTLKFKLPRTDLEHVKINIQGISNNGNLFSEERTIQME